MTAKTNATPSFHWHTQPGPKDDGLPCLVLLHGAGGSGRFFQPQLDGLTDKVRVLAPDLPGHGASGGAAQTDIAQYAHTVIEEIEQLRLTQALFIGGLSMGGAVAMHCLAERPDLFAGGVLLATGAKLKVMPAIFEAIEQNFDSYVQMVGQSAMAPGAPAELAAPVVEDMVHNGPEVVTADFRACDSFDIRADIAQIETPCLLVGGEQDFLTPPRYLDWLAENLPQATRVAVEQAGHFVSIEKSAQVNKAILEFLSKRS